MNLLFIIPVNISSAQTATGFAHFINCFPRLTFPFHTCSIEKAKTAHDFWGLPITGKDTLFYSQPNEFSKDLWVVCPYAAGKLKFNNINLLLFFLRGDSDSGANISNPIMELCTYKNGVMVARVILGGGMYDEYNYNFYESTITKDGIIKILEESWENDNSPNGVMKRILRILRINEDGKFILLSSYEENDCFSLVGKNTDYSF